MKFFMMVRKIIIAIFNHKLKKVDYQHFYKEQEVLQMIINYKELKSKILI